jgi:hypothetical protein
MSRVGEIREPVGAHAPGKLQRKFNLLPLLLRAPLLAARHQVPAGLQR